MTAPAAELRNYELASQLKAAPSVTLTVPGWSEDPDKALKRYQLKGTGWLYLAGRGILADQVGLGKFQNVNTNILSPSGWRRIGDIRVGDRVIGSEGQPVNVIGVYPQGVKPSYRVTFSDHSSVEAGPDHLWSVDYWLARAKRWHRLTLTTEQLRTRPRIRVHAGHGLLDLSKTPLFLPMLSGPVQFEPQPPLPIGGYTLGQLVGNGSLTGAHVALTSHSDDWPHVRARLEAEGVAVGSVFERKAGTQATQANLLGLRPLAGELPEMFCLSPEKRLPRAVFTATPEYRTALLHGLMDSDGSVAVRTRVNYHTTSEGLARDVQELVEGLGGIASVRSYDRTAEGKPVEYQVRLRTPFPPVSSPRKLARYRPSFQAAPKRSVQSVEYVGEAESVCIAVDAPDRLYVTEHCVLTHNTIQTLALIQLLRSRGEPFRTLVVTLPGKLAHQWQEEAAAYLPTLDVKVTTGELRRPQRAEVYSGWWDVLVTTYPLLLRDSDLIAEQEYDMVVFDESSYLRNHVIKTRLHAARVVKGRGRRVLLDATPVQSSMNDLHSQLELIGMNVFGPLPVFEARYLRTQKMKGRRGQTTTVVVGYNHWDELVSKVDPFILRRRRDDPDVALELPPVVPLGDPASEDPFLVSVDLGQHQRQVYENAKAGFVELRKAGVHRQVLMSSFHDVRRACSSTMFSEDPPHSSKIEWLLNWLRTDMAPEPGRPLQKVIVYASYVSVVEHVMRALHDADIPAVRYTGQEDDAAKAHAYRLFREDPRVQVLVGTSSVERGLNLQVASALISFDQLPNPQRTIQLVGRLQRIGSLADRILVGHLVATNTIEEKMASIIARRAAVPDALFGENTEIFRTLSDRELDELFGT